MDQLFEFLHHVLTNYGMSGVILCSTVGAALYVVRFMTKAAPNLINTYIEKKASENAKEHVEANIKRKKIAVEVSRSLSDLIIETDASIALLYEFSNGSSNLAGLPFLFVNATSESLNKGTRSIAYEYQRINISLFADFISEVEDKGFFYAKSPEDIKDIYPTLYALLKHHNTGSVLFYAVYGVNELLGMIEIATSADKPFDRHDVLPSVAASAQRISNLLNLEEWEDKIN